MIHYFKTFCLTLLIGYSSLAKSQNLELSFNHLDSLYHYVEKNSLLLKIGEEQILQAKWTKIATLLNVINIKSPFNASVIDNQNLPVSFLPAEIFGGNIGSFKQVVLGQRFISNYNFSPQIDILNLELWHKAKNAKLGEQQSRLDFLQTKKNLLESVAAAFYNIQTLQKQIELIKFNLNITDTLHQIIIDKINNGILRTADENDIKIKKMQLEEKLLLLQNNFQQQLLTLKILADIPTKFSLKINPIFFKNEFINERLESNSMLLYHQAELKNQVAKTSFKENVWSHFPILSFVGSWAKQNNSNINFFDEKSPWIYSNYWGLKLTFNILPDMNKLTKTIQAKHQYSISEYNQKHLLNQTEINNEQLTLEYQKSIQQLAIYTKIHFLKENTFLNNKNLYEAEVLSLDKLLFSLDDKINAELNIYILQNTILYNKAKITLNNQIQ